MRPGNRSNQDSQLEPVDEMKGRRGSRSSNDILLEPTHWLSPGQAAYDFRSDYVTSPTLSMLESIISTTLRDDVMMEDPTTNSFQNWIAGLTGHEDALLTCTGTMSNQVALRTALITAPYAILTDHRSHILTMEGGGPAVVCSALIQAVIPSNGHHMTLGDVKKHAIIDADICKQAGRDALEEQCQMHYTDFSSR